MYNAVPDIPMNQRMWNRQKHKPTMCRYCKTQKIVFLKNVHGNFVACEAAKVIEKKDGRKILDPYGMICHMGERIGWPIHHCPKNPAYAQATSTKTDINEVPLPEFEPADNDDET